MAGTISEFFGYRAVDESLAARKMAADKRCPFLGSACTKLLGRTRTISGVCSIRQKKPGSPSVICCPNRMYAEDYKMLRMVARRAFHEELPLFAGRTAVGKAKDLGGAIAVFGHGWGGELRLPKRDGVGSYFVDWVLTRLDGDGGLVDFTAVEVQTIDTTGKYSDAQKALANGRSIVTDTVGLNWENVSKRIIPQIIYKGQVLQREELCKTGLYFVCPMPIYSRVIARLGGKEKIPAFPTQPAAIHFIAYDYAENLDAVGPGEIASLDVVEEHCTTVYKIQEAFSAVSLPEGNVYGNAIRRSLYGA